LGYALTRGSCAASRARPYTAPSKQYTAALKSVRRRRFS
jgi:hypothetical protein